MRFICIAFLFLWGMNAELIQAQNLDSVEGDRQALVDLYNATNGDNWTNNTGWLNGNPSNDWHGVEVDSNGRVIKLKLRQNNLKGTSGLPSSIGNLKKMTYFNVHHNEISGQLPESLFSQCTSLVYLYLNQASAGLDGDNDPHEQAEVGSGDIHTGKRDTGAKNKFTGEIPSTTNLPNLKWLTLSWTEISNVDPIIFGGTSTVLEGLYLTNNIGLAGTFKPIPPSIGNLTSLTHLAVNSSKVNEYRDSWGGELPREFSNLTSLRHLRMGNNGFTGHFPSLENSLELRTLVISRTPFETGFPIWMVDGTIPNPLICNVAWNAWTDAVLPNSLPSSLFAFDAVNAGFTGTVPEELFTFRLTIIDISRSELTGSLPPDLQVLRNIRNLWFSDNNLSGQWPDLDWTNKQGATNSAGDTIHPLRNFTRATFINNKFVFRDMLVVSDEGKTLFEWYKEFATSQFSYASQQEFGEAGDLTGSVIDFSARVSHADNVYEWTRNGTTISGETGNTIDTSSYGSGTYKLTVTNPGVPGLTLESIDIDVTDLDGSDDGSSDPQPPDTPLLLTPSDNSTDLSVQPLFEWSNVAADTYRLQVSGSSDFTNPVADFQNLGGTSSQVENLDYGSSYFWRVQAVNADGESDWSDVWSFTTRDEPLSPPGEPTPVSPSDGATGISVNPAISWNGSEDAESYRLQLSLTSNFSPVVDLEDLSGTSAQVENLSYETTYFWRVQAVNSAGESNWSELQSFTTREEPVVPPSVPELVSPANDATGVALNLNFSWNEADDAESYTFQITSSGSSFGSDVTEFSNLNDTEMSLDDLEPFTQYHWRVRAVNGAGESGWSETWVFQTEEADQDPEDDDSGGPGNNRGNSETAVEQNYPNPFNPSTVIQFRLAEAQQVSLKIYNLAGQRVATLVSEPLQPGTHSRVFDADGLASGIYFYRLITEKNVFTKKMTLIK